MDLIYADEKKVDQGILKDYVFDLAIGIDENNFECRLSLKNHCCKAGYYLYIEGTEYGGIIDSITVNTKDDEVIYGGRTWHGIIASRILEPDSGNSWLSITGYAWAVTKSIITRARLTNIFRVDEDVDETKRITVRFPRYIDAYAGINYALWNNQYKAIYYYKDGYIHVKTAKISNYSDDNQLDSDLLDFSIMKNYNPINHLICLGSGVLQNRMVAHIYVNNYGQINISSTALSAGTNEIAAVFDYPNAEDELDLRDKGLERIKDLRKSGTIDFDLKQNDVSYEIGDIISAKEHITDIEISARIIKKIVSIKDDSTTISYEVEEK